MAYIQVRNRTMQGPVMSSQLTPLARAVIDAFQEGVVVFDADGEVAHVNEPARAAIGELGGGAAVGSDELLARLARFGARIAPLRIGETALGKAVFIPAQRGRDTLADRERHAILQTLEVSGWRLAETARRLGISRTTLWRRLKEYGLNRDGRGKWSRTR